MLEVWLSQLSLGELNIYKKLQACALALAGSTTNVQLPLMLALAIFNWSYDTSYLPLDTIQAICLGAFHTNDFTFGYQTMIRYSFQRPTYVTYHEGCRLPPFKGIPHFLT